MLLSNSRAILSKMSAVVFCGSDDMGHRAGAAGDAVFVLFISTVSVTGVGP